MKDDYTTCRVCGRLFNFMTLFRPFGSTVDMCNGCNRVRKRAAKMDDTPEQKQRRAEYFQRLIGRRDNA